MSDSFLRDFAVVGSCCVLAKDNRADNPRQKSKSAVLPSAHLSWRHNEDCAGQRTIKPGKGQGPASSCL